MAQDTTLPSEQGPFYGIPHSPDTDNPQGWAMTTPNEPQVITPSISLGSGGCDGEALRGSDMLEGYEGTSAGGGATSFGGGYMGSGGAHKPDTTTTVKGYEGSSSNPL